MWKSWPRPYRATPLIARCRQAPAGRPPRLRQAAARHAPPANHATMGFGLFSPPPPPPPAFPTFVITLPFAFPTSLAEAVALLPPGAAALLPAGGCDVCQCTTASVCIALLVIVLIKRYLWHASVPRIQLAPDADERANVLQSKPEPAKVGATAPYPRGTPAHPPAPAAHPPNRSARTRSSASTRRRAPSSASSRRPPRRTSSPRARAPARRSACGRAPHLIRDGTCCASSLAPLSSTPRTSAASRRATPARP